MKEFFFEGFTSLSLRSRRRKMSEAKRTIEDVDHSSADEKRARRASDAKLHREIRYDFIKQLADEQTSGTLLTKLHSIKQRLNQVKSQLSDKDIADWNRSARIVSPRVNDQHAWRLSLFRHTAYMNTASTIVPYLREHCQVEVGTQAWAKMFEILSNFDLIHPRNDQPWRSLHLCEAPGAFISALNHFLQTRRTSLDQGETKDIQWQWFAQTLNPYYEHSPATAAMLIDDDRLIFHTIDDDHWDFGCDNSGNLLNPENIEHYIQRFQRMEIDFVTADGSFDVQDNPSEQELLVYPLLKTEIQVALACLRAHGHFVIKFFTLFEPATIDLIFSLYRSFAQVVHLVVLLVSHLPSVQISMFKPTTSKVRTTMEVQWRWLFFCKRGNSEMYVVCRDFDREKWLEDSASISYPHSFAEQLLQCCELFQSSQINTIEENLRHFSHQNRRFRKHLYRIKCQTLERYIHQCQLRELLSTDRHLLKADLSYKHFHLYTHQRARIGTFNDQHQLDVDLLRHPSFCLRCSQSSRPASNELCSICQIVSQLMEDPSSSPSHIFIGQIHADDQPTRVQCVFGQASVEIGNSCFCDRFLLKLSDHQPSLNVRIDIVSCSSRWFLAAFVRSSLMSIYQQLTMLRQVNCQRRHSRNCNDLRLSIKYT